MNELELISRQQPGLVSIDNLEQIKSALAVYLTRYENPVYTEETLNLAKADKKELTRLRRQLDERRKDVKRTYLEPYNAFESQVKELLAMIDAPLDGIKSFVSEMDEREKAAKRAAIEAYCRAHSGALQSLAEPVLASPAFFEPRWLNKSTSAKAWQGEADAKLERVARDVALLETMGAEQKDALLTHYLDRLDIEDTKAYRDKLASVARTASAVAEAPRAEDTRPAYKVLRLRGTASQVMYAMELLGMADVDVEELEDGMPAGFRERGAPDFTSFVAFDIETTGTYGAANGDGPAEITEIGAVRVENGVIVEKFDELVDPGRKLVPRVARLTGITDEMLRGKPKIGEVLQKFADFARGSVLVGHNIAASDLYYMGSAAARTGVVLPQEFFDTYRYARRFKEQRGWERLNLEYLSARLGIEQAEAHRAWCDAQANVGVYFALKGMG